MKGIPKGRSVRPWMLSKEGWLGVLAVCFMVTFSGIYVLASGVPQVYTETSRVNRNLPLLLGPQRPETTYPFGGPVHNYRKGVRNLYMKSSSGAVNEELLLESPQDKAVNDWSADGRFLLYHSHDPHRDRDLWVLPLDGDHKPWVFLKTNFNERWARFSPDGRWVAYTSNESGHDEIYVRPFLEPAASTSKDGSSGGQWQVSTAGGIYPLWRSDGKELYYLAPEGQMMAVPITVAGTALAPAAPVVLFLPRIYGGGTDTSLGRQYDITRDGRFLINTVLDAASSPITFIQNWKPTAK